jgi:hypothetical protein
VTALTTVVVGAVADATRRALDGQTHPAAPLAAGDLTAALALGAGGWLWLVGSGVEPEPRALEHLLAAAGTPEAPAAPLLASRPVDAAGTLVEAALPRGDEAGTGRLLASVGDGLVPIRDAPLTSLLVSPAARTAAAPPDPGRFGAFTARAWTRALLAREPGYLVLASRVRVPPPPRPDVRALPSLARLRRDGLLTPGETLRIAAQAVGIGR